MSCRTAAMRSPRRLAKLIKASPMWAETKLPEATPPLVAMHVSDEKPELLARVRYNRLVDFATECTCHFLQSGLTASGAGRAAVETDDVYVAFDRRGDQYVIPVRAGHYRQRLRFSDIADDVAICRKRFPSLPCVAIGAQYVNHGAIALFIFNETTGAMRYDRQLHIRLAPAGESFAGDNEAH